MDSFLKNCSAGILAGGENKRMPVPKAFVKIPSGRISRLSNGETIIEKNLNIMKQLFGEVFIVTNQPELYLHLGVPLFGDIYNLRCPMTGIFTSLVNSTYGWVFISACDMPFINRHLIRHIASKRGNYDAVVPKSTLPPENPPISPFDKWGQRGIAKVGLRGAYTEPLFACYSKRLLSAMEETLLNIKRGLKDFLSNNKVKYINTSEIKRYDPEVKSFINLNTVEDIKYYLMPEGLSKTESQKYITNLKKGKSRIKKGGRE